MTVKNNTSKIVFIISAVIIILAIITVVIFSGLYGLIFDNGDYLIAADASYVICGGERYVPVGESITAEYSTNKIIAEHVPIENGDFLDRYFIYGYIIYGTEDESVIYVHTAESSNSAAGYYIKESLAETNQ